MASDLQSSPTRPVRQNHAANNAFGDLISPKTPSAVPSRIMQASALTDAPDPIATAFSVSVVLTLIGLEYAVDEEVGVDPFVV